MVKKGRPRKDIRDVWKWDLLEPLHHTKDPNKLKWAMEPFFKNNRADDFILYQEANNKWTIRTKGKYQLEQDKYDEYRSERNDKPTYKYR